MTDNKYIDFLKKIGLSTDIRNYIYEIIDNSNINELKDISKFLIFLNKNLTPYIDKKNELSRELNIEIIKSLIKSKLSYQNHSLISAYKIVKKFIESKNLNPKDIYFTPNYYIIHLPNDKIEEGNLHIDQDGSNTIYTLWTPLVDYNYQGLSYYRFGYYLYKVHKFLFRKHILNFIKNINVFKFKTLIWSGLFVHKGNLNNSNMFTSASVVWISKGNKKKSDVSYNLDIFEKTLFEKKIKKHDINNMTKAEIQKEYSEYLLLINELLGISKLPLDEIIKNINIKYQKIDILEKKNQQISFFLAILAQRINTMRLRKINFSGYDQEKLVMVIDIVSTIFGLQSYSSFMRISQNNLLTSRQLNLLKNAFIEKNIFKDKQEIINFEKYGYQK